MAGKLSFLQEEALVSLYRGNPFGIDARSVRGLLSRGLVVMAYWNETFPQMPALTADGTCEAELLDMARRASAFERLMRGTRFGVVDGGRA